MPLELVPSHVPLFDAVPRDTMRAWILERASLPLRTVPGMPVERWADYHLDDIQSHHAKSGAITFYGPALPCLIMARRLEWDTQVLGVPSISLDHFFFSNAADTASVIEALRAACGRWRHEGLRLLVHKTSPANFGVLAAMAPAGFDLLCCHLDYLADADRAAQLSKPIEGYEFGPARSDEEEQVARLTQDNYALMDRFNIDPLVPRDRVRSVYYEWGRNAFHGYSDLVWVARHEGNVVGISFWSDRAHLETLTSVKCALNQLGAVDRRHAGRGIFRRIQSTVLAHYRQRGVRWATMATNALNHPTQRSFQSIGAVIFDSTFTFRKDLQRP